MKKTLFILVSLFMIISFTGCHNHSDHNNPTRIGTIEKALGLDLDDLTDDYINGIYSHSHSDSDFLIMQYISLDGAGEHIHEQLHHNQNWKSMPYNATVGELLESIGATKHYSFDDIQSGHYILSGSYSDKEEIDFDIKNADKWNVVYIGIWDNNDETLYFISATK